VDEIEKQASAKRQKKDNGVEQAVVKQKIEVKTQKKKKVETSSSDDSSESEEEVNYFSLWFHAIYDPEFYLWDSVGLVNKYAIFVNQVKIKTKKGVVATKPPVKVSSSESSDDDSSDESSDVSNMLNCISILFILYYSLVQFPCLCQGYCYKQGFYSGYHFGFCGDIMLNMPNGQCH
jgi:hypothetical protein